MSYAAHPNKSSALAAPGLSDEGFLKDRLTWTPRLAEHLAAAAGIALTERHWRIITASREDAILRECSPELERIAALSGLPAEDIVALFLPASSDAEAPATLAVEWVARISGLYRPGVKPCREI